MPLLIIGIPSRHSQDGRERPSRQNLLRSYRLLVHLDKSGSPLLGASMYVVIVLASAFTLSIAWHGAVHAQKLPPPSRTLYKCEVDGKVTYSDNPCVGAQKIDVEPTRGVSKLSGKERIGKDVSREHQQEALAEAVRPITGKDAKQLEVFGRRLKLSEQARRHCAELDASIPLAEREEQTATKANLQAAQERLFAQRDRYRKLGC